MELSSAGHRRTLPCAGRHGEARCGGLRTWLHVGFSRPRLHTCCGDCLIGDTKTLLPGVRRRPPGDMLRLLPSNPLPKRTAAQHEPPMHLPKRVHSKPMGSNPGLPLKASDLDQGTVRL